LFDFTAGYFLGKYLTMMSDASNNKKPHNSVDWAIATQAFQLVFQEVTVTEILVKTCQEQDLLLYLQFSVQCCNASSC
jgi:hypothetical protein